MRAPRQAHTHTHTYKHGGYECVVRARAPPAPITEGEREYTQSGHQSQRDRILTEHVKDGRLPGGDCSRSALFFGCAFARVIRNRTPTFGQKIHFRPRYNPLLVTRQAAGGGRGAAAVPGGGHGAAARVHLRQPIGPAAGGQRPPQSGRGTPAEDPLPRGGVAVRGEWAPRPPPRGAESV
eukprot:195101-Prorocentrum_minimum.AAC.1